MLLNAACIPGDGVGPKNKIFNRVKCSFYNTIINSLGEDVVKVGINTIKKVIEQYINLIY